jgi:hypothetical protein
VPAYWTAKINLSPVVVYSFDTRFLAFRVRVFQNRVLRRRFGAKKEEGTGEWRK